MKTAIKAAEKLSLFAGRWICSQDWEDDRCIEEFGSGVYPPYSLDLVT